MASARFSASAAFMLKKTARRPSASMVCTIACALGGVERRSRWTPKMSKPLRASSSAVAPPKPLEAPRISAQPLPAACEVIACLLFPFARRVCRRRCLRGLGRVDALCIDQPLAERCRVATFLQLVAHGVEQRGGLDDAVAHALRRHTQRVLDLRRPLFGRQGAGAVAYDGAAGAAA